MKKILFILILVLTSCSLQKQTCNKETKKCCEKKELK